MTDKPNVIELNGELDSPELGALVSTYMDPNVPDQIKRIIRAGVKRVFAIDLTVAKLCAYQGPAMRREEMTPVATVLAEANEVIEKMPTELRESLSDESATVTSVMADIGEAIDKGVKRLLLEDSHLSRGTYMHLLSAVAEINSLLGKLALTEEQKEMVISEKADQSLGDIEAQKRPLN